MSRKNLIIVLSAVLLALGASGKQKRLDGSSIGLQRPLSLEKPLVSVREMKMRAPGEDITTPSIGPAKLRPFYRRPAGAFYCTMLAENGVGGYSFGQDFAFFKPYSGYTYCGKVEGADENTHYGWDVFHANSEIEYINDELEVNVTYGVSNQPVPIFYAVDGDLDDFNAAWYSYQMPYFNGSAQDGSLINPHNPAKAMAIPSSRLLSDDEEDLDFLLSSRTIFTSVSDNVMSPFVAYSGAEPYGDNTRGWWFGKNGAHVDGMAQIFEKPEHPYLLKKVYMMMDDNAVVTAPVELTCKVYKLDDVPAYDDTVSVTLPEEPGKLILIGEGMVTPETCDDQNGFIEFTLYGLEEDDPELTYECTPTIDYPIMVVIDGYNDLEAEGLKDFTAYIAANYQYDEGYGETAYLKYPRYTVELDENGDTIVDEQGQPVMQFTGEYYWRGLNNFFRSGTMMTAFSIFIVADQPFITFDYAYEDGVYTFPAEGGEMSKTVEVEGNVEIMNGIYFYSWYPSADEGWTLTWNGNEVLPDWLHIELEDLDGDDDSGWGVFARVAADPLPAGVDYREATIRFEIPGDYIDYMFMQGEKSDPNPIEPPEINIGTINAIIRCILSGEYDSYYDADKDGSISVADINKVIDIILND